MLARTEYKVPWIHDVELPYCAESQRIGLQSAPPEGIVNDFLGGISGSLLLYRAPSPRMSGIRNEMLTSFRFRSEQSMLSSGKGNTPVIKENM
jgi:hypothetical protein